MNFFKFITPQNLLDKEIRESSKKLREDLEEFLDNYKRVYDPAGFKKPIPDKVIYDSLSNFLIDHLDKNFSEKEGLDLLEKTLKTFKG